MLVNRIYEQLNREIPSRLKKLYRLANLAKKDFGGIWSSWYGGHTPPKLEVDIIFVFEDFREEIDDALIIGVEVKYFKGVRGFYEGLGQTLSYSIFGFDEF